MSVPPPSPVYKIYNATGPGEYRSVVVFAGNDHAQWAEQYRSPATASGAAMPDIFSAEELERIAAQRISVHFSSHTVVDDDTLYTMMLKFIDATGEMKLRAPPALEELYFYAEHALPLSASDIFSYKPESSAELPRATLNAIVRNIVAPANQSAPRPMITGTKASVFTLLMSVGLPHKPD